MTPRHFSFPYPIQSKVVLLPSTNKGMGLSQPRVSQSCVGSAPPFQFLSLLTSVPYLHSPPNLSPTLDTLAAVVGSAFHKGARVIFVKCSVIILLS